MQAANIPHNVLIADCGSRVFIWPQAYAERQARGLVPEHLLDVGVNPAVWEISGHMVLKRAQVGGVCVGVGVGCARGRGVGCLGVVLCGCCLGVLHLCPSHNLSTPKPHLTHTHSCRW